MGIREWFTGGASGGSGYSPDEARADAARAADADNRAAQNDYPTCNGDTRGDNDAIEDRYRAAGTNRDYNDGRRFGAWDNQ